MGDDDGMLTGSVGAGVLWFRLCDKMFEGVFVVRISFTVDRPMAFLSFRSGECEGVLGFGPGEAWSKKDRGTIIIQCVRL